MRLLSALFSLMFLLALSGVVALFFLFQHYSQDLPDYSYLKDYHPPTLTRFYADDGRMLATIAAEQRIFAPISVIPHMVSGAFLAAEDHNFYTHKGVDIFGVFRAMVINLKNVGRNRRPVGASTITQQVAKNMLLTNEVSISRKVREMILARRLEKILTKERLLEIYLNEIFLGHRSYGVAAAALNYFNKSLDELSLPEAAFLAALPKGPNNYNPESHYKAAVERRNWVISRMLDDGLITPAQAVEATASPLVTRKRDSAEVVSGGAYFTEEVRRELVERYGAQTVLEGGLSVKTSLDSHLQKIARTALRRGLINYDRRKRGYRGPVASLAGVKEWPERLLKMKKPVGSEMWDLAVVVKLTRKNVEVFLADGSRGHIPWLELAWARHEDAKGELGGDVRRPKDVLKLGDVVLVEPVTTGRKGKPYPKNSYTLRQVPIIQGAIVAMDPHTGRVFAMVGGFSSKISQYNRAVQAYRQPGSAFKPFVYLTALDKGFTPSSLVLDAPFEYEQGNDLPTWKPENYSQEFYGPTPLRVGLEKSRNVMTVRLANAIGMAAIAETAETFGVVDDMPELLAFSLGAKETTPLRMATAYGMIVNGGKKITPSIIDRIQDQNGKTIWRSDKRACEGCIVSEWQEDLLPPDILDTREQIQDPRTAYQVTSMMEGVVKRGTGRRLAWLGFPIAGKTGTTNESRDAWFVGFTPDLVAAVYVGFDEPKTLGKKESGSSVAVPIFKEFFKKAMVDQPAIPFRVPSGLRMVKVDSKTGALASFGDKNALWESYLPDTEPKEGEIRPVLDGSITGEYASGVVPGESGNPAPVVVDGEIGAVFPPVMAPEPTTGAPQGTGGLY